VANPDYFTTRLWRRLMGDRVLNASSMLVANVLARNGTLPWQPLEAAATSIVGNGNADGTGIAADASATSAAHDSFKTDATVASSGVIEKIADMTAAGDGVRLYAHCTTARKVDGAVTMAYVNNFTAHLLLKSRPRTGVHLQCGDVEAFGLTVVGCCRGVLCRGRRMLSRHSASRS
jgi:hypothetical protein